MCRELHFFGLFCLLSMSIACAEDVASTVNFAAPGDHEGTITIGDDLREYWVHVPKSYDANNPSPLLILLPGGKGRISAGDDYRQMFAKAEKERIVLVTAQSSKQNGWSQYVNSGPEKTPLEKMAGKTWADEPAFFRALIDEMQKKFKLMPNAVFISGSSSAGLLVYKLSVAISDRITAANAICGAFVWRNEYPQDSIPPPARPVSFIAFHGDADKSVIYTHGANANITVWSAHESTGFWVKANGCNETPSTETLPAEKVGGATVNVETWSGGKATVALYTKVGGTHEIPDYVNDYMWDFFMKERAARFPNQK